MTASITGSPIPGPARGSMFSRFIRRPAGAISAGVLLVIILVAVFAPLLAPYDPNFVDLSIAKAAPGPEHWLGGDTNGRDILSRLVFGTRLTLLGALISVLVALAIGVPAGLAAGYFDGPFDRIAAWISDALQAVPGMIILLIVAAATRNDFNIIMVTVGVFMAPGYFRLTRSTTIAVRSEPYIDAALVSGLTHGRIIARHVVQSVYAPVIIQTALTAGMAMGMQAGLQFLGIGGTQVPGWGAMMNEGFRAMLTDPLLLLWPSLALGVSIAALAVMGSTLGDVINIRTPSARKSSRTRRTASAAGHTPRPAPDAALSLANLRVIYHTGSTSTEVVHGVSLDVAPGEVVGLVGESGSGKSQTAFSILDLLPPTGEAAMEALWIGEREVSRWSRKERHRLLGTTFGYIPQEPMTNLDPSYTIGYQLTEPLRSVHGLSRTVARSRALKMLDRVGIPDPERVMKAYPHQLSGGMAQRILIAGAVAAGPSILIADEPTTALDVTVQAEVLELLRELQQEFGMALIIVTHNFGVVADICDRVVVMRQGLVVEQGDVAEIFSTPRESYTRELIAASLDGTAARAELDAEHARQAPEQARPDDAPEHGKAVRA